MNIRSRSAMTSSVSKLLVALGFIALALLVGCGGDDTGSLTRKANEACGPDTRIKFKYHQSGFAARAVVEVTCRREDGSVYLVLVEE